MRILIATALLAVTAAPTLADETTGEILAFDRKAGLIVMMDKSVWSLDLAKEIPADLAAGDTIHVVFDAEGEDGITQITAIHKK